MRKFLVVLVFIVFIFSGCDLLPHPEMYQLVPEYEVKHPSDRGAWIFNDLKGDGRDMIVSTDRTSLASFGLFVSDAHGKIISQLNFPNRIRGIKALKDPRNNNHWLFYSYNDQKHVFLNASLYTWQTPLQRSDFQFQGITRADSLTMRPEREYFALIYPELIDDIDRDGRYELVCTMLDGFTATPRGLLVYDLISRKIKWRYNTPCNISSVLCDDFDGNGSKELVLSTMAMKNTPLSINNLDDSHCYLLVLSPQGKKLFQREEFRDYGQIYLNAADVDQDGKNDIFALNTTWGHEQSQNKISVLNWNGSKLVVSRSKQLPSGIERKQNEQYLVQLDSSAKYHIILVDRVKRLLVLDDQLNDVPVPAHNNITYVSQISDLDLDGNKELLALTTDDHAVIMNKNFKVNAKLKIPFPPDEYVQLQLLNTGLEEKPLIAFSSQQEIAFYSYHLLPLPLLLLRIFKNYIVQIFIVMLILVIYLLIRFFVWKNMLRHFFNLPGLGFIYVQGLNRIVRLNITARSFAHDGNDPECRHLDRCFPNLSKYLRTFANSHRGIASITASLADTDNTMCRISMIHAPALVRRDVICFIPTPLAGDSAVNRAEWADTARRLSHHVRRHLTNILLVAESLGQGADDTQAEYLQIVRDEIDKVRIFTHSFQRFTELKDYDLRLMDIIPSVEHSLVNCQIPGNIKVVKSWDLTSVNAYIEPIRLEEALVNIVNNAIDAMPKGGILHILIKELNKSTLGSDYTVLIEIEDSGHGIPARYLEEIWKPFFTTKQSGTGIGIPESKKIIESIGGKMDIQSEENVGTTVSLWLKGEQDG